MNLDTHSMAAPKVATDEQEVNLLLSSYLHGIRRIIEVDAADINHEVERRLLADTVVASVRNLARQIARCYTRAN